MGLSKDQITDSLPHIPHPRSGKPVSESGIVRKVAACENYATLTVHAPDLAPADQDRLHASIRTVLAGRCASLGEPICILTVEFVGEDGAVQRRIGEQREHASGAEGVGGAGEPTQAAAGGGPLPGVRHVIAVGAGKGGVGKSTVSVNLAVGLARAGHSVGLMDGDIFGPSLPTMLGLHSHETNVVGNRLQPFNVHGVKSMTIGKLVEPDKPLIWRGPMAHGAFKQLTEQTDWGELDHLIIDLPPGTGDVCLTMCQMLQLTGAIVVCTPQRVAQDDATRAVRMFQQLGVEVLGIVENMSWFVGDDGKEYDLFGRGGAESMAQRLGIPFLGALPITMALRANSDAGEPSRNFAPETSGGEHLVQAIGSLVENVGRQVGIASIKQGKQKPTLSIS